MTERLDQIFVLLEQWLVSFLPGAWRPAAGVMLSVAAIVCLFPALFALTTVFERKGLARIQNRIGPNRVGWLGILQPVADGIKSLTKEDIVPLSADAAVHFLAPLLLVVAVFMGFAVLPMGRNMVLVDMDAGLLFFFAMGASTELSVFMAGWSSRNKYSLLGAMRAVAQMISYEVLLLLSSVAVVMITGSLSLTKIVAAQNQYTWGLSALVHLHAVGTGGLRHVRHCGHGRDQSLALRPARRRVGTGRRLPHGIFRLQICALLSRRIPGHVFHLRPGHDALSRRMVGAIFVARLGPVVDMVLLKAHALDLRLHLDARNSAAPASGSADELCLEVCSAAHTAESAGHRGCGAFWATDGSAG